MCNIKQAVLDLYTAEITEFAFMDAWIHAIQVDGDGELEKRIADRLESLEVEEIIGVGHCQSLYDVARAWTTRR